MDEKVLVTGAGGFVGAHLVKEFSERGFRVTATATQKPWYLKNKPMAGVTFVPADLKNPADALIVEGHDRVYHLGAIFNFNAPLRDLWAVNVNGTRQLSRAAARAGVKTFVNFSSGAIYGPGENELPVEENTLPKPTDDYALTKWEGEQAVFDMNGENGMRVVSLRPGAIYGPYSVYGDAVALRLLKQGLLFAIPGLQRIVSSHIHVRDCARAAIHLSENPNASFLTAVSPHRVAYNICDDSPTPNEDLLREAAKVMKDKGLIGFFDFLRIPTPMLKIAAWLAEGFAKVTATKPIFDRVSIDYITTHRGLSNQKLKSTGFELQYPAIKDGLAETIKWYEDTDWRSFREDRYNWN